MAVCAHQLTLGQLVFDGLNTNRRICITSYVMFLFTINMIKIHLAIMIALTTLSTGIFFFYVSNIFLVAITSLTLVFRFLC